MTAALVASFTAGVASFPALETATAIKPEVVKSAVNDEWGVGLCFGLGMMAAVGWFIRLLSRAPPPSSKALVKPVDLVQQDSVECIGLLAQLSPKSFSTVSILESPPFVGNDRSSSPNTVFAAASPQTDAWTSLGLSAASPSFPIPTPTVTSDALGPIVMPSQPEHTRFEALLGGTSTLSSALTHSPKSVTTTRRRIAPMRRAEDRREALLDGRISPVVSGATSRRMAPVCTSSPPPAALPKARTPPALKRSASIYDARLRDAFDSVDLDRSNALSKRQLYAALARVHLTLTPAEQLRIWKLFDSDTNGSVDWLEFRSLGAALLELAEARPSVRGTPGKGQGRGGFAQRSFEERNKMHMAAGRIQGLARQRSHERVRVAAVTKAL